MLRHALLLSAVIAPFASCGTSSRLIEDRLTDPRAIASVELGTVRFDYAKWANHDARDHDTAKKNEAAWSKAIGDAFRARATQRGLSEGEPRTRVDITIVDLDPGKNAQRSQYGADDGVGIVSALVEPQGHGSFRIDGRIAVGGWGGEFDRVLEKLGKEIADHLVKRQRG
jgi:hypothetical protein